MRGSNALVVGTAGHIDHGKTSLVYALTGIDTDRLKEEKQRGISIDLGFAEMQLPDGLRVSFVDVPGHERFVRNMLAGAAGIEAVLLIVAGNESVMPQTREHFEICRLLGIRHGFVVITKADLASPSDISQTRQDIQKLVRGSFLEAEPIVEVSAVTRAGFDDLTRQLALVAAKDSSRDQVGLTRMPIDRAFAVKGFGTVVTGTLQSGSVNVGDTLELHPSKIKLRVRGLQAQHYSVERAVAGQRLAINLAGIDQQELKRGQVLATADALIGTRLLDVNLEWVSGEAEPAARELFVLHIGTSEASARISRMDKFARLRLAEEVIAAPGDRFVIRRPSPARTVGGGSVIDAFPPQRLNRLKIADRLKRLSKAPLEQRLEILLDEVPGGRKLADLVRLTGASRAQLDATIAQSQNIAATSDERAVTLAWIKARQEALLSWLAEFHKANPNAAGAPLAAARLGLDTTLAALIFKDCSRLRLKGEMVSLSNHQAQFSVLEESALHKIETSFRIAGFQPPAAPEVLATCGVDAKKARALLEALIKDNRLVKLHGDLIFHVEVISHIRASLLQHKGRKFSIAEFKTWTNISRKFAIPLLEYLDQQRVTRRDGEMRLIL